MKAVIILSGGIDSSTLAYWLNQQNYNQLIALTFNYGQKQIIELTAAKTIATNLAAVHKIIDISFMKDFLQGSSLTDNTIAVPHGVYTKNNMQLTVVPNRNSMFLSMAWAIACVERADILAYGAQGGDHYLYPDTRIDYINALNLALRLGTEDCRPDHLQLIAPLVNMSKEQIVKLGTELAVPYADTYSCYQGDIIHCGLCGACQNRKLGFNNAEIADPTIYQN